MATTLPFPNLVDKLFKIFTSGFNVYANVTFLNSISTSTISKVIKRNIFSLYY